MYECDELQIYRGSDIQISDNIIITQPALSQIEKFGERLYFQAVHTVTSVGADLKWQLWENGIDYTTISDYDLFIKWIFRMVSSKKDYVQALMADPEKYQKELKALNDNPEELQELLVNPMKLTIKYSDDSEFDFADFIECTSENGDIVLYNKEKDVMIDKLLYLKLVDVIRSIHGFKRNNQMPANERTKMDLIEDARDDAIASSQKPYKSILKPLISTLSIKTGQLGSDVIWDTKINMFFDAVRRIGKIQDAEALLNGAYSGFASLKGVDKTRLDVFGAV